VTAATSVSAEPGPTQPSKTPTINTSNFLPRPGIGNNKPRLIGIDVTRGLALLGMIAVHALIPYDENFQPNWVSYVATGHASAVFAVLAGVGLSLTTGRARVPWASALPTAAAVGGRAAAIAAVGFALGYADAEITGVILPYYAVLFLLAIPLLFLRTRTLLVVGVFAAVAVPVLSQFVRPALPVPALENPTPAYLLNDPLGLLSELLVTGAYPALPWMAYICAGLIVGRLTLSSVRVAWRLLILGAALAITAGVAASLLLGPLGGRAALELAGPGLLDGDADSVNDLLAFGFDGTTPTTSWWWLATGAPHAGAPLDLLGTIGSAVGLLGAMLLLGHLVQPTLRRMIDVVMAPLAAAGGMTLSLYTAHIVFMNSPLDVFEPTDGYVLQVVAVLLFGLAWRLAVGRGPLETAVTAVATTARTWVDNAIRSRGAIRPPAGDLQRGRHRPANVKPPNGQGGSPSASTAVVQIDHHPLAKQRTVRLLRQVVARESIHLVPATVSRSEPNRTSPGAASTGIRLRTVRLIGIDITRGLALLGMMAVHTLIPYDENFDPNWVSYIATGHSSATFAVLAGVGLSLTTGRARVPWVRAGPTAAAIAGRAVAIGVIGLALGYTDASIAGVILPYYALLFVLAIPLVFMRTRAVVVAGLAAAIVVPVLSQFLRPALPVPSGENLTFGDLLSDPLGTFSELLVSGSYPVLPWMAYLCAGLVVGRMTLSSVRIAWRLLIWGAALGIAAFGAGWLLLGPLGGGAALQSAGAGGMGVVDDLLAFGFDGTTPTTSWWWLATRAPHAGTPLDLLGTIGGAVALLGAMLLLGHIAQPILRRVIDVLSAPLAAAGAMTLTLYTAHVVFMNSPLEIFSPTTAFVLQLVAVLLFGVIWRQIVGRGPLETAVAAVSAHARALAQSGHDQSDADAPRSRSGAPPSISSINTSDIQASKLDQTPLPPPRPAIGLKRTPRPLVARPPLVERPPQRSQGSDLRSDRPSTPTDRPER